MEGESLGKTKTRHKLELKSWEKEKVALVKTAKKRPEELEKVRQREEALLRRHAEELAKTKEAQDGLPKEQLQHGGDKAEEERARRRLAKQRDKKEKKQEARWAKEDGAAYEVASAQSPGEQERAAIAKRLRLRRLEIVEVAADGWCMFAALAHQLGASAKDLRKQAAEHMLQNAGEFGVFFEDGSFEAHCAAIAEGPEWGGEAELVALARVAGADICVVSADSEVWHCFWLLV